MRDVAAGQTDYTVFVKLLLTTGAPATGLVYTDIDIAYARVETDNDVTTSDVTPATLASLTAAHSDWGFLEVSATDHPGLYRLDIADAVFASGAWEAVVTVTDASGTDFYAVDIGFRLGAAVDIAAAVWDRVLTGATHNITNSAGRRLRTLDAASIRASTAQGGAANSITLDTGASATNEIYDSNMIVITGGTGEGQTRVIVEYNGTTKVAIVDQVWQTNPDATSEFQIIAAHQSDISHHGLAQAGGATSITLASTASPVDDTYVGSTVYLSTSTGTGQARLITDYDGTTKVATVSPAWATNPTSSSVYKIIPTGRVIVDSLGTQAKADVNTEADAALVDIHLDHLLAADYDPASKPGTATALLNELVENDGGVSRYTTNALEQAPSSGGGGPTMS